LQTKALIGDLEAVSAKVAATAREHAAKSTTLQQRAAKLVSNEPWRTPCQVRLPAGRFMFVSACDDEGKITGRAHCSFTVNVMSMMLAACGAATPPLHMQKEC
jgi:hypothetical protein